MDLNNFYMGLSLQDYEYLGAKVCEIGTVFRTYAPNANSVTLIGEFSNWSEIPMNKVQNGQFYEVYVQNAVEGMMYKFKIYSNSGRCVEHCDPYGYGMELRPNNASIIRDLSKYKFKDKKWIQNRNSCHGSPLNIYEIHLGSWRKEQPESPESWYSYSEIADLLIPYVKEQGYNYIEFMPLSEHPCDESWGYQNTGFFSPTSRYGTAYQLMELVDKCHQNNIGVIMDFVPVHFAIDDYGLKNYDGNPLYEYPNNPVTYSEWGSLNFMHSRGEVRSFLQSSANYWLEKYHFDGLRMDAISRIIYWQGDPNRGVNNSSVSFVREMNRMLKERHPNIILFAEDSTNFPLVTKPYDQNGLGFDYKWDMGWMNDTFEYMNYHPSHRKCIYNKLTFSMMYFYNEHYLLPISHDEVVHEKRTVVDKMNGSYEEKFAQTKTLYMYMYAHPGKKLNFMGNELAIFREWDEKRQLCWNLLDYPAHFKFNLFMKKLNHFYLDNPSLSMWDDDPRGFQWLGENLEEKSVYIIKRYCPTQEVIAVINFDNQEYSDFEFEFNQNCKLKLALSSDDKIFGGSSDCRRKLLKINPKTGKFKINISPLSAMFFTVEK